MRFNLIKIFIKLQWLSFIFVIVCLFFSIWGEDTIYWLKLSLTELIGIIVFYILEQKSY